MAHRVVENWPVEAYKQSLRPEGDGGIAETHLALLQPPGGKSCRAYVKHFDAATKPRCLFNEWFSFHVLDALGVPQPRCAIMLAPKWGSNQLEWAFVSCEASPVTFGTPKQIYRPHDLPQLRKLSERLLQCVCLPVLVAVDQLIANDDRNLGNLVFTGDSAFVAIDHSNALHGPAWTWTEHYQTQRPVRMKLVDLMRMTHGTIPPMTASALIAAAEVVQEAYYATQDDVRRATRCGQDLTSTTAMEMTWWRCNDLSTWIKDELGVI